MGLLTEIAVRTTLVVAFTVFALFEGGWWALAAIIAVIYLLTADHL